MLGTQRNLYSTDSCWGFALGVTQILAFALGVMQVLVFLDTNMLVSRTRIFSSFASQWECRLKGPVINYGEGGAT